MQNTNRTTGNFGTDLGERTTPSIQRARQLTAAILEVLRVGVPAVVQRFVPGTPATVDVIIATRELVSQAISDAPLTMATTPLQMPVLKGVPIGIPDGGGWSLTLPILPGDECMLIFSDTSLDQWLQSGAADCAVDPASPRRHDLADAVAWFGIRSRPRAISGYSTSSAQLRNDDGSVVIDLAPTQITITAPTVQVNASTSATVTAPTVSITGSTSLTLGDHTTIDSKVFLNHTHSGVKAGPDASGPVT